MIGSFLLSAAIGLLSTDIFYVEIFGCKMAVPEGFYLSESSLDTELVVFHAEPGPNAKTWGAIVIQNHPEISHAGPSDAGIHELNRLEEINGPLEAYEFVLRHKETGRVMLEQFIVRNDSRLVSFQGDAIESGKKLVANCNSMAAAAKEPDVLSIHPARTGTHQID